MILNRRQCCQFAAWTSLAGICGCKSAPVTGRRQLMLMPEQQEISLGLQGYEEATSKAPLSQNSQYVQMVQRVGERIANVSGRTDYQWEFRLLASPEQNAFALPGGKVAVHEGILPVCQHEGGLAVVMSHEVAHALARHGGERMSQGMAVNEVQRAVSYVMQREAPAHRDLLLQAYGVATQYGVILPYSRKQESEADHIGVTLMARAGYDPSEAPRFWTRFGQATAVGAKPPEFLSTHPSDARRAADLQALLAEVEDLYANAPTKIGTGEPIRLAALPAAAS